MRAMLQIFGLVLSANAYAQTGTPTPVPTPAAPLQSVNNQILQINNNVATEQPSPTPNPTVNPVPANAPKPILQNLAP